MLETKEKIKYVLGAIVAISVAYAAYQYGQSVNDMYAPRTFTVEGTAKVETSNDIATFTATVYTEGGLDQKEVQTKNTEAMNKVVSYLESKEIDKDDIQTENYSLQPKYNTPNCTQGRCEASQIIGYTVSQNVRVKVRKADTAGELVSGVVQNGATSVSQVGFEVEDNKAALQDARSEALKDAQQQAERLAKSGKFRLGKMVTFYEQGNPGYPYPMSGVGGDMAMMEKSAVAPAPAPDLQPGSTEGEIRVTVTYEIK